MNYKDIKTNYVKSKIKDVSWEDREYIDALMFFEQWILGNHHNWNGAMSLHNYKEKYELDYWEILRELKPMEWEKQYKRKLEDEENSTIETEKRWIEDKRAREKARREWLEMGGKL